MPPWTIVLTSTAAGIVAAAALAIPEIAAAPRSEIGLTLLPKLPALAVAALGLYGLVALSLTTMSLVARVLRMHRYLMGVAFGRAVARRDWIAMLAANGSRPPARTVPEGSGRASDTHTVDAGLTLDEASREIARRHYISLARAHFFSVLIVLGGLVALGAAQNYGALPFRTGAIPTVSAVLVTVGLVLLAALGRIALDVAAEPLLDGIASSPGESVEIGLLRRIVALKEQRRDEAAMGERVYNLPDGLPEQLAAAIGQGYLPLLDAVAGVSENSRALEAAVRSSVEAIASQQRQIDDRNRTPAALPELQATLEELTAVLRRLSAAPDFPQEPPVTAGIVPSHRTAPAPGLARELGRLLQEIETAR